MALKRFLFLVITLIVFTFVYFGIEIGFNYFSDETVPKWKSLSIAGISAALVFYESFSINPNFTFTQLLSNQQLTLDNNTNLSIQEIEAILLKAGYTMVSSSSHAIKFKTPWKLREPSLRFVLLPQIAKITLKVKPAFKLNLFNMGRSHQHLVNIKNALENASA